MRRGWWLTILTLFVLAGCDAPTRPEHTTRIESLDVTAVVQPNGDVAMKMTVTYPGDEGGALRVGAPTLGTVSDVTIDGSPRSASGANVDLDPEGRTHTVEWVLHGAVERYGDGAIVTLPVWTAPQQRVNRHDKRVPVTGSLQLPAAPVGKVRWHDASPADTSVNGTTVSFRGDIATTTSSAFSFLLPPDALPAAPLLAGASRVSSYESRQAPLDDADAHLAGDLRDDQRREDLIANVYWGAVALEIAIPFLLTLLTAVRTATVRRRANEGVADELSDPPSDLPPAVVSLLHAEGQDIGDEAVAGTILDLANDHKLEVEGITSERYTMRVTGGSPRPGERALLAAVGERAAPDGLVTGPPLGLSRDGVWWRALRHDVVAVARSERLLRRRYRSGLFITAVVALALTTLPLYARSPETVVGGLVVAVILSALPFIGGYVLTAEGHRERAKWEAYRRHLEAADLGDVGVPGVVVWERALVYGAALGVAAKAIGDLK